jgi:hypothetical protein
MPDLGVLVVHGMGAQEADFADGFVREMRGRLEKLGVAPDRVAWRAGWWADLVRDREEKLWRDLSRGHDLDFAKIRKFIISHFGDALAYQRVPVPGGDVYTLLHVRIRAHLAALREQMGGDRPIVVLAHSLGSTIISNYTWDEQKHPSAGASAVEQMRTLAGLVTFGSNIPLFTLGLPEVVAIRFPGDMIGPGAAAAAKWLNFYDSDDVFAFPLRPLSPSYAAAVAADIEINVGGLLASWNPLSHDEYWTDNDFTAPVAKLIAGLAASISV